MEQEIPLVFELFAFDFVEFLVLLILILIPVPIPILILFLVLILILHKSFLREARSVVVFFAHTSQVHV
jgi:hypothetical protein